METDLASTLLHLTRLRLLKEYPAQIDACLDVLTDEDIWWRPHEQSNAAATLVVHLSGSNRYYLEQVIGGRDIGRDRAAEFAARGGSKAHVRETWLAARRAVEAVLDALQPSQLAQTTDATGKTMTWAQVLLHVTHHNAVHMGQIVWITKMLHPGALDELWRKSSRE
ncbi:MAG: DUF1572 family protein [Acidobacteria bacterium]|nr:DUF1572 family protein [Acidobacteriota bacterium]